MYLFAKSSLVIICATVTWAESFNKSVKLILCNQSALFVTSASVTSRTFDIWSKYDLAFSATCSFVRAGLVSDLPDGSPTIAVAPPTIKTILCPKFWNSLSFLITTVCPKCKSGLVGSIPNFTLRGVFVSCACWSFTASSSIPPGRTSALRVKCFACSINSLLISISILHIWYFSINLL